LTLAVLFGNNLFEHSSMSLVILKGCNVAAHVACLFLNFYYGKPKKGDDSIRIRSEAYDHVAVPKGAAFSIWGLIYLWTLVFVGVQAGSDIFDAILPDLTPWFCAGQLMQGIWVKLFTESNVEKAATGGDATLWAANVLLIVTPAPFLKACEVLGSGLQPGGAAYWVSYGITINTAWVLLAAGLTVNMCGVAGGMQGSAAAAVAITVLAGTFGLELWITGLIGSNPFNYPTAFLSVGIWALFWVFMNLKYIPSQEGAELSERDAGHQKRMLQIYGSTFVGAYKWIALLTLVCFVGLEILVCVRKGEQ